MERRATLIGWGVDRWDLRALHPNRLKFLARLGKRSTNQALQRAPAERRYPILVAFLRQSLEETTDEVIDLFDHCGVGFCPFAIPRPKVIEAAAQATKSPPRRGFARLRPAPLIRTTVPTRNRRADSGDSPFASPSPMMNTLFKRSSWPY